MQSPGPAPGFFVAQTHDPRIAGVIDRDAGDIPIEQPTHYESVINNKTSKAIRRRNPAAILSHMPTGLSNSVADCCGA